MDSATAAPEEAVPATEVPQHLGALERANKVRLARADLKRAVARGDLAAADVVSSCPWEAATMSVAELLTSQRRWGPTRARKLLMPLRIAEGRQLGALTERQRRLLVRALLNRRAADRRGRVPDGSAPRLLGSRGSSAGGPANAIGGRR
ncbi:MAG: hypothetical protein JST59_29570 [Actinobacteria bacterium]|nr:hypothetical protein [Actinomycetota bacterium]